nr:hypothetical protein [Tanacetum cinerariifolium]
MLLRPSAPIIEDWVSYSEDESETKTPHNVPSFVQPPKQVKSPRPSVQHVETSIPIVTSRTTIPKPTSNGKRRNRKACFSIPSEDPYEEAAQQLFEQAPHSLESLLATPRPGCEVGESSAAAARWPGPTMAHRVDCSYVEIMLRDTEWRMMAALELVNLRKDCAVVRAETKVLRSERLAYEKEGIQTREALARSEACCRALEARVAVLETHARRLEWQRQAADDFAVQHIMRTQALEARARDDTLEDTGSSS